MVKLAKYLKPFILPLLVCIALLFGQAMCDLSLPNYMSNIVNVGIQQNGIEDAAPRVISEDGLKFTSAFLEDADAQALQDHYHEVAAGSREAQEYQEEFPNVSDMNVWVLNAGEEEAASTLFGKSAMTMINVMSWMAEQSGQQVSASSGEGLSDVEMQQLYALEPMIAQIPQEQMASMRPAEGADESLLQQMSGTLTKLFYVELGVNLETTQSNYIWQTGLFMLLIALAGGASTILVGFFASRIAAGVALALRRDVFDRVESFSAAEFDRFSTASLITRNTNDVTQVQMLLIMGIRMVCYAPIMGIGGIIMALQKSVSMSWIIALAVIVLIGLIIVVFSIALPKFKVVQKQIDKVNLVARENLSGLMVIRAFGTQDFEKNRFDKANQDLTATQLFVNRVMVIMMPLMMLIMNCVTLLIVWFGAHQIADSQMQVGDMMAFMQYAMQIIMSFLMISVMFIMIPRAAVSGDRIQEVLETEPSVRDPQNPKEFISERKGYVEFKDVSFRYQGADENVLENLNFVAKPGETTAFIGSTGSGKSTLVNLIPRFYDVTQGSILVNGVDVRDVCQHALRDQIGYVPQKGTLVSGTIASNLRYGGKNASQEDLEQAAKIAQALDFIEEKPDGMESEIAQGGTNVSGGQKQRLSIARALVKKAPIYIFDDSFSALDFKTDANLRRALKQYTGDSTVLIVAQRVSTIMNADQIIVLDEGRIVGKGTHRELLHTCPTYYEIASSQLRKEELE